MKKIFIAIKNEGTVVAFINYFLIWSVLSDVWLMLGGNYPEYTREQILLMLLAITSVDRFLYYLDYTCTQYAYHLNDCLRQRQYAINKMKQEMYNDEFPDSILGWREHEELDRLEREHDL